MAKSSSEFSIRMGPDGQSKVWSKTVSIDGGGSKTMRIEQVKNGFIIEFSSDMKDGDEWKYKCDRYISPVNPLEVSKARKGTVAGKVHNFAGPEFFQLFDSGLMED